jgi:hypothetical protein
MRLSTMACAAGLFAALGSVSYADAVLTTDPTGFTNEVFLTCVIPTICSTPIVEISPFTDPSGNTATMVNMPGSFFVIGDGATATFMVAFAHPVVAAGFDISADLTSNQGPFQLSNGDSTASSFCGLQCFLGVTDTTPFTSFSIVVTVPFSNIFSPTEIEDFRYTPASIPEPASGALVAPLLIAGFAALSLKRRAK